MTPDEIIIALKSPDTIPFAALTAGLSMVDGLAPRVYATADKFCGGVYLLPADNAFLFYGLHVLAAARHPKLLDHVIAIARQPGDELEQLFPDHIPTSLTRLLLSVWDDDADALFALIEQGDLIPEVKWALFDVLARLTFDSRIPRERTIDFLGRLEREQVIEPGDCVWWGWEEAVTKLGVKQLEPALRRSWSNVINEYRNERDQAASLEQLNRTALDPSDPGVFDDADVKPIDDPVEAVGWIERRAKMHSELRAERAVEEKSAKQDDPAKAIRLTDDERDWLAGFLVSRQAPSSTMALEMLDGMFTALVIGPAIVLPSEYMPEIWGTQDGAGPEWHSLEQAEYFMNLLMKHWNAIAARRSADAPHNPFILDFGDAERGQLWATGFVVGVDLGETSWDPIFQDKHTAEICAPIFALLRDDLELFEERVTPEIRADMTVGCC